MVAVVPPVIFTTAGTIPGAPSAPAANTVIGVGDTGA
jgi:hypothetical protein